MRNTGDFPVDREEKGLLIAFVALQTVRTSSNANRTEESMTRMMREVTKDDPRLAGEDLEKLFIKFEKPGVFATMLLPEAFMAIEDLKMHLVCATGDQSFITSDNPVFQYNQYCGKRPLISNAGGICCGLQIFVPLSPKYLLILYDGKIYKIGKPNYPVSTVTDSDIGALNLM